MQAKMQVIALLPGGQQFISLSCRRGELALAGTPRQNSVPVSINKRCLFKQNHRTCVLTSIIHSKYTF